jgi:hypothetical protein
MRDLTEIKRILGERKSFYTQKHGVSRLGIFGSYSRGEQTSGSDIDILVEFERPIGLGFVDLAEDMETLLGTKVDLVSKKAIKPRMLGCIERDLVYV